MSIKTGKELAAACVDVAKNYKTLYVMACFGAPMNEKNKDRYSRNHEYNRQTERTVMIKSATSNTFGFDCVGLIKGLLWGWSGDKSKNYGGASYGSNGVADTSANGTIRLCKNVSTDFSTIKVGEAVWKEGHIGIYIGDGLVVESTPAWKNCVQITALLNLGGKVGYNNRAWTKHGELPYVTYEDTTTEKPSVKPSDDSTENKEDKYTMKLRTLKKGCKGEDVKALQILLIGRGYSCGKYGADGDFGAATEKAVKAYQKAEGLEADGIVGPATMSALLGA